MKKLFIVVMMMFSLMLCSCGKISLEKAFERLDRGFTMECEMEMTLSSRYITTQTIELEMLFEVSKEEVYTEVEMEGNVSRSYIKIKEDEVDVYSYDGDWEKETISMEEYEDEEDLSFLDIDFEDFVLEDNVWVGDTEILSEQMEDYFKEMVEESLGSGTVSYFNVSKYNIEMNGRNISKIDISVNFITYMSGIYVNVEIDMPIEVSNIGKTKVTVPKGLPE